MEYEISECITYSEGKQGFQNLSLLVWVLGADVNAFV